MIPEARHSPQKPSFSIALVHHPVVNRKGDPIATSVTNLDLHDIARTARTYGADAFYVVTPFSEQHELVNKIKSYWEREAIREYHPDRAEAFTRLELSLSVEDVLTRITPIFTDVLDDDAIVLTRETTARDVEGWDSLAHINLIISIEKEFKISFTLVELQGLKNVGDMLDLVVRKIA